MEGTPGQGDTWPSEASDPGNTIAGRRLVSALLIVVAACCSIGVVAVRLGPASGRDTAPLTAVTTAIADGDLRVAASITSLPNPPGYPLLAAPFVVVLRSFVGSPSWCAPQARFGPPGPGREVAVGHALGNGVPVCGRPPAGAPVVPPWYRSQGLLGVATWLVLALGALGLLRAGGADSLGRQAGLLAFLVVLPAASSAMVQLFHPQDVVSLGLGLAGLAQTMRGRWWLAGALFGAAVLSKQFALLLLVPALVVAPGARPRLALGGTAAAVFLAGLLPFALSAPRATLENLSGYSGGGASAGQTVLTLAGVHGAVASAVARDAPVLFAVVLCLWAVTRRVRWSAAPAAVVGLALACTGSRLVFESVIFPYYLLSASVLVLLVDLVARRWPQRSLVWCAAAAFFVAIHPGNRVVAALGTLVLAAAVVAIGLLEVVQAPQVAASGSESVLV